MLLKRLCSLRWPSILMAFAYLLDSTHLISVAAKPAGDGCGMRTETKTRIVGGQTSFPGNWPWMAAMYRGKSQYCAGTVISDRHVLTAAHCVSGVTPQTIRIRLGDWRLDNLLQRASNESADVKAGNEDRFFGVQRIVIHKDYEPRSHLNDIAVIRLNRLVTFSDVIGRICLPPPTTDITFEDREATVAGWGTTEFLGSTSSVLREVQVPIWKNGDCLSALGKNVYETSLCAGGREKAADACQGDSGGPLMLQMADQRWAAIGVVSWGIRCGEPTKPGVYTRTTHYTDWILTAVKSTF